VRSQDKWSAAVKPRFHLARLFGSNCDAQHLTCGSDGDRLREIDAVTPPLVPLFYVERQLQAYYRSGSGRYAAGSRVRRIPEERWPEVITRAKSEGLRGIARDFGVSHETIRAVVQLAGDAK